MEAGVICSYRGAYATVSFNEGASVPGIAHGIVWKAMHSIRKLKSKKIEGKMIKARRMSRVEKRKGETKWIM